MKLAKREKYLVAVAACFIGVVLAVQLLVLPFFEGRRRLHNLVAGREKAVRELVQLRNEYLSLRRETEKLARRLAGRPASFTLFSFLEKAAGEAAVKEHIKYMKPSATGGEGEYRESLVEMKLERIALSQLVDYLRRIESPENLVIIKRLALQADKQTAGLLDAVIQVVTFKAEERV